MTQDNKYRGFFVIYTLELKFKYRVCVLIPTPMIPYLAVAKELEKIDAYSRIKILSLPDLDYLNNDEAIKRLREWCYWLENEIIIIITCQSPVPSAVHRS